ncbi:MAG TPA: hypothetical protein VGM39_23340 [Kofleriaceae bacterium]|jgi:hypothetical protein
MRGVSIAIVLSLVSACAVDSADPDEPHTAATPAPVDNGPLPDRLSAAIIRDAVTPIKDKVLACPNDAHVTGVVKVKVNVQPDGSVEAKAAPVPARDDRVVDYAESEQLRDCVARVMATASFPRTRDGGSFSYPFVF